MNKLTSEHVKNVCLPGQRTETCRYLVTDSSGWLCGKELPDIVAAIEARRERMTAQGDNCSGPPDYEVHHE